MPEPRSVVWVVEMLCGEMWEPCASASLVREDARTACAEFRRKDPDDQFRVQRYVRDTEASDAR